MGPVALRSVAVHDPFALLSARCATPPRWAPFCCLRLRRLARPSPRAEARDGARRRAGACRPRHRLLRRRAGVPR
eukprot:2540240-Pyramimonas_sp.AAC.1